jgi:hypothetical protein
MTPDEIVEKLNTLRHPMAEAMGDKTRIDEFIDASEHAGQIIDQLMREIGKLEDEVEELRDQPWPRWADEIAKKLQSYGVDVGPEDEWDLPNDLDEWLAGAIEHETRQLKSRIAGRETEIDVLEEELKPIGEVLAGRCDIYHDERFSVVSAKRMREIAVDGVRAEAAEQALRAARAEAAKCPYCDLPLGHEEGCK